MKGVLDRESRRSQRSAGGIDLRSSRRPACSRERARRVGSATGRQRSALERVRSGGECPSARRDQPIEAGRASLSANPVGVPQLAARFTGSHSEQGCSSLKCGLQKSIGRVSSVAARGRKTRVRRTSSGGAEVPLTWRRGVTRATGRAGVFCLAWTTGQRPRAASYARSLRARRQALWAAAPLPLNRSGASHVLALHGDFAFDDSRREREQQTSGTGNRSVVPAMRQRASEAKTRRPRLLQPNRREGSAFAAATAARGNALDRGYRKP